MTDRPVVLLLRALGLGDFLTAVPAYRGLRRHFPGHEIVLAAPAVLAELAGWTGAIDRVLPTGELQPVGWPGPPADLAVNLHGRGPHSHRILAAVPARRRIGFAHPQAPGFAGPAWLPGEHEVRRWCRLLAAAGIRCEPTDLLLTLPSGDATDPLCARPPDASDAGYGPAYLPRTSPPGTVDGCHPTDIPPTRRPGAPGAGPVLLHPGAAAAARRWPIERFAAVARVLAGQGCPVLLTGTAVERPVARQVAEVAGLPQQAVLAGRTGLADLARLVAGAALVICGDTGIGHLATATGTPSVLLFGPVPPAEWGPLRDLDRHLVLWRGRSGDPHGGTADPGLTAISVPEVLAAARALLHQYPLPAPPAQPAPAPAPAPSRPGPAACAGP